MSLVLLTTSNHSPSKARFLTYCAKKMGSNRQLFCITAKPNNCHVGRWCSGSSNCEVRVEILARGFAVTMIVFNETCTKLCSISASNKHTSTWQKRWHHCSLIEKLRWLSSVLQNNFNFSLFLFSSCFKRTVDKEALKICWKQFKITLLSKNNKLNSF